MNKDPQLTVTREYGQQKCVLTRRCPTYGLIVEIVTTLDPQMMVDYLDAQYPGWIVTWRLLATDSGQNEKNFQNPDFVHSVNSVENAFRPVHRPVATFPSAAV
jgi:hypothetical protein